MKTRPLGNPIHRFHLQRKKLAILGLLLLLTPLSIELRAQDNAIGAQINVRVTDPQGAIVPGAEVSLYTRDNQVRIKTLTDNNGAGSFKRLAPGEYLIEAEGVGFSRAETKSLRVDHGATTTLEIFFATCSR
jgi:hypothetical protein